MKKIAKCYVDGSYSPKSNNPDHAGWGVLFGDGTKLSGSVPHFGTNQIAGECEAVIQAVIAAAQDGIDYLRIFYDYKGLPEWAQGTWKTNNAVTKRYKAFFSKDGDNLIADPSTFAAYDALGEAVVEVKFIKINAEDNKADALATAAIGVKSVH